VVAITHDRYFLDNVAGWILELDRGKGIPYEGNYSGWLEQKSKRLVQERLGKDADRLFPKNAERGMGGRKIRSLSELPPDALLVRAIRIAVALNEEGVRPKRMLRKKPPVKPPPYLVAALKKNARARATFERFTPAQRREYVEWLTEAKQEATRERRLATTIEWLALGRQRNWKYQNC